MGGLRAAITFLTRVPAGDCPADIATAPPWFPFVGAIIGAFVGVIFVGCWHLVAPAVAAVLALATGALVTGAFHHDGLADTADAFGGGWSPAQRLEIMKDSRHGTFGVIAIVLVVVAQVAALATLGPAQGFAALVAAHTLGRAGAVALMMSLPAARPDGLGAEYTQRLRTGSAISGIVVGALLATIVMGSWVLPAIAAVVVTSLAVGVLANRKIGGIVGDVLGAAEQVGESAVLIVAAAVTHRHGIWPWWR
ncbi:MAG: adenosylcobinamide-GDP ribazoletransferase [Acidimicrobiales bacterium]